MADVIYIDKQLIFVFKMVAFCLTIENIKLMQPPFKSLNNVIWSQY